jgi:WhiB family redox-sensing transcriptional regulator
MALQTLTDLEWRSRAKCSGVDADLFFAAGALEHKLAKKICRGCSVRAECLAYALQEPVDHGIWGGLTERERRRFRKMRPDALSNGSWRDELKL